MSCVRNIFSRREDEPHISIDASNSLHILHISKNEEGNYTCSINGRKVKQFELKVVSKSKLLNQGDYVMLIVKDTSYVLAKY